MSVNESVCEPSSFLDFSRKTPSLEEQIALARRLFDEAVCSEQNPPFEDAAATLPSGNPFAPDKVASSVPDHWCVWKGLNVGWFLNVLCQTQYFQKLQSFGCELWFVRDVCIVELIRRSTGKPMHELSGSLIEHIISGSLIEHIDSSEKKREKCEEKCPNPVGKATIYISYHSQCTLAHLMGALRRLDPSEYMWLDLVCVDQFSWSGEAQQCRTEWMEDLQKQMKHIGRTALIPLKWNLVMLALRKMWVLWEMVCSALEATGLSILLREEEEQSFLLHCFENSTQFDAIQQSIAGIDANKAVAQHNFAGSLVHDRINKEGAHHVNLRLTAALREWMATTVESGGKSESVTFLNNLATFYQDQGRLTDAEPLFRRALDLKCQLVGEHHPETVPSMNNLAVLLLDRGKLSEAEPLLQRALSVCRKNHGNEHPDTLSLLNSFAMLSRDQGRLSEAEAMFREAANGCKSRLGIFHSDTIVQLNNLGSILLDQGELDEAETLFRQTLDVNKMTKGEMHPDTLTSINNLAAVLQRRGKLSEAEQLFRQVSDGRHSTLGSHHPSTLTSINNVAHVLMEMGRYQEAERLFQSALAGKRKALGDKHPSTLATAHNLATLLEAQGRLPEAEEHRAAAKLEPVVRSTDAEEETELGAMDTERPSSDVATGSDLEGDEGLMTDMVDPLVEAVLLDPLGAGAAPAVQAEAVAAVASMQTDAVAEPLESETPEMQGRRTRRVNTTLTDVDVVLGRGELANLHPGNIRLREERDKLKPTYQETERNKRRSIAEKLVRMVHGWGGAFLYKDQGDGDTWSEIGDDKAIRKCHHLLREDKKTPSKRKQPIETEQGFPQHHDPNNFHIPNAAPKAV